MFHGTPAPVKKAEHYKPARADFYPNDFRINGIIFKSVVFLKGWWVEAPNSNRPGLSKPLASVPTVCCMHRNHLQVAKGWPLLKNLW